LTGRHVLGYPDPAKQECPDGEQVNAISHDGRHRPDVQRSTRSFPLHPIIYDVAVSADGFICGAGGDVSRFPHHGDVVADYMDRLAGYRCAIMGRATYEFGYAFGLSPGANPYPHMRTLVMSAGLDLPADAAVTTVRSPDPETLRALKPQVDGPIYLCGGGAFAGWCLRHGLIDRLRLKRAPILLGDGVRLFGGHRAPVDMRLITSKLYDCGVLYQDFDLALAKAPPQD